MSTPQTLSGPSLITHHISNSPVVLFMKGTPEQPACGFSNFVVRVLRGLGVPFVGVDILTDPGLREDLKAFSNWPTFPQLYVNKVFIGGCDITRDLLASGELQTLLAPYQQTQ
jgi:monothiol glutaredoxin